MGTEIERKFLVIGDGWRPGLPGVLVRQGYLSASGRSTVRVRVQGEQGFLTIKGPTEGITRLEYEYGIPVADANEMLNRLNASGLVEKRRYWREFGELTWEVDEFLGKNRGLVLAEVELDSADRVIALPDWVGLEVSDDPRYYNVNLAAKPYTTW